LSPTFSAQELLFIKFLFINVFITDDTGKTEEVAINETKYDADTTYVEMKRFKCLFIYKDKNVLHIKAN
jgi:hypothetical protein